MKEQYIALRVRADWFKADKRITTNIIRLFCPKRVIPLGIQKEQVVKKTTTKKHLETGSSQYTIDWGALPKRHKICENNRSRWLFKALLGSSPSGKLCVHYLLCRCREKMCTQPCWMKAAFIPCGWPITFLLCVKFAFWFFVFFLYMLDASVWAGRECWEGVAPTSSSESTIHTAADFGLEGLHRILHMQSERSLWNRQKQPPDEALLKTKSSKEEKKTERVAADLILKQPEKGEIFTLTVSDAKSAWNPTEKLSF